MPLPPPGHGRMGWIVVSPLPVVFYLFFNFFKMPTGSMEATLLVGDKLVARWTSAASLQHGDMVIYYDPAGHGILCKRVVGLSGDRVRLERKALYINGAAVSEPYVIHRTDYTDPYRDNFPEGDVNVPLLPRMRQQFAEDLKGGDFVVPQDTFFVLGDNRDQSYDSRYTGVIPAAAIIAKPWMVYFSTDIDPEYEAQHPGSVVLFRARWNRVLKRL